MKGNQKLPYIYTRLFEVTKWKSRNQIVLKETCDSEINKNLPKISTTH